MDILQRELKRKKEALLKAKAEANGSPAAQGGGDGSKKRKYLKVSDIRRIEEEEREEKERKRWARQQRKKSSTLSSSSLPSSSSSLPSSSLSSSLLGKETNENEQNIRAPTKSETKKKCSQSSASSPSSSSPPPSTRDDSTSSPASITQKLRQMGLVVRYFGEGNTARLRRLKTALEQQTKTLEGLSELEEFRLGKGHGIRNPFLEKDKKSRNDQHHASGSGIGGGGGGGGAKRSLEKSAKADEEKNDATKVDLGGENENEDDQSDPPKLIYKYLKGLLKEWERELADRPESMARSVAGRNESKTLKQCKDYIRPLFKLLKSRQLEEGLQIHLLKIVNFAKEGEFVRAHDSYMDVAIGRAAWPIGVTMVGIHARSGRAKIESANVAHVMNSELQRKYLTSVKRLLTFDQKRRTDVDPSKKVR